MFNIKIKKSNVKSYKHLCPMERDEILQFLLQFLFGYKEFWSTEVYNF